MIQIKRTDSTNADFVALVKELDAFLAKVDGDDHDFYNQFNGIDSLKHVVVAYDNDVPVACGAIKSFDAQRMEVKRMFTLPKVRGRGIASQVMNELEIWAAELGYEYCVLETGINQQEAIWLYERLAYERIANYGQYVGVENSFCFEKKVWNTFLKFYNSRITKLYISSNVEFFSLP